MNRPGRLAAIVLAVLALAFMASWWVSGVVEKDADFTVPRGATLNTVAEKLEQEKVIGSAADFPIVAESLRAPSVALRPKRSRATRG